ncbi:MAG: histidine--tRNA ligase [Maricaulaceae bacterium]
MASAKKQKTFRPKARRPRGLEDKTAEVIAAERGLIANASAVYESYGFAPLETPAFEYADALGKFLPDSDRPNEGVFAFQDDDAQWMALRYDLTAPLARFVAERYDGLPKPFRRYQTGSVFRNEKPGPGRFREFQQCDADSVGAPGPAADAEMIALAAEVMGAAGLAEDEYVVRVNDRRLLDAVLAQSGLPDTEAGRAQRLAVLRAIDKLDRLGLSGVEALLGAGRKDESGDYTKGAGLDPAGVKRILDFVQAGGESRADTLSALAGLAGAEDALAGLAVMDTLLNRLGVSDRRAAFDPSVVRGLAYYTGPVFEVELQLETVNDRGEPARFGSVGGGGRYDDLVARFKGQTVPATGFSFGVTRFSAALAALGRLGGTETAAPVVILSLEADALADYFSLARALRDASVPAEVYLGGAGMKTQLKYADKRGARLAIIRGEDERQAGQLTVKDLVLGAELAKTIDDNKAWREAQPAQVSIPMVDPTDPTEQVRVVAAVREMLDRGDKP